MTTSPEALDHTHPLYADLMRVESTLIGLAPWSLSADTPSTTPAATPIERLTALSVAAADLSERTARWVRVARDAGATWQEVGDALGVTRQAAQQRFR